MNQLLVTAYMNKEEECVEEIVEKQYQPKKLITKKTLIMPVIFLTLMFVLSSYYVYAMHNKDKVVNENEQISFTVETNEMLVDTEKSVEIAEDYIEEVEVNEENIQETEVHVPSEPYDIAYLKISKINLNLPVLSQTSEELMNQKLNKFWGGDPNEAGNFCIIGHNYKRFLKRLPEMRVGDTIELKDTTERTLTYKIYDIFEVIPEDTSCTSQLTDGKKEITIITCVVGGKKRLIIKATEVI